MEQLSVLNTRLTSGNCNVDFALWQPFARRVARSIKFRAWVPQPDGSYLAKELAGPGSYEAWESSFNVYVTAMIMLGHWTFAGAGEYRNRVRQLNAEWPD